MVIHKLDELRSVRLDDRVCDFIPELGTEGKETITIRHVLGHRAGIPNLPPELMDLLGAVGASSRRASSAGEALGEQRSPANPSRRAIESRSPPSLSGS